MNGELPSWVKFADPTSWALFNLIGQVTTLPMSLGGLNVSTGVSGGVLGFTSTNTVSSSVLLTQYGIVLGGGAGATPTSLSTSGVSTNVLHGNSSNPYFGAVILTADVSGLLPVLSGGTNVSSLTQAAAINVSQLQGNASSYYINVSNHVFPVTTISFAQSPYTVAASDYYIRCTCSSGNITVLFPAASTRIREIFVKKIDSTASTVTISSVATDTFDGAVTSMLASQWAAKGFISPTTGIWERIFTPTI